MASPRTHLENAPIVEAVIDFRVMRQEQVAAETFADLSSAIGGEYGAVVLVEGFVGEVQLREEHENGTVGK
jgi:hypothetical protein